MNSMRDDKRLLEDYLPLKAISAEASREKSVRKGHISTLHLWWARRPLVACRAAVYGALVNADRFQPKNGPAKKRESLGWANAAKFVERLRSGHPFHPALTDLMRERWTAVDAFQRTRGALRFLASCLHSLKESGGAQPLLGPAGVPLGDVDVRVQLLKELGAQNDFDPAIAADIAGPNARAKRGVPSAYTLPTQSFELQLLVPR